jgi:hypothetical protein
MVKHMMNAPYASLGMGFGRCPHAHIMLAVLAIDGVSKEILVDQDLGVQSVDMLSNLLL